MNRPNVTLYGRLYRTEPLSGSEDFKLVSHVEDEKLWPTRVEDMVGFMALLKEFLPECKSCVVCGSKHAPLRTGFHRTARWRHELYTEHVCSVCWRWQMVLNNKAILSR